MHSEHIVLLGSLIEILIFVFFFICFSFCTVHLTNERCIVKEFSSLLKDMAWARAVAPQRLGANFKVTFFNSNYVLSQNVWILDFIVHWAYWEKKFETVFLKHAPKLRFWFGVTSCIWCADIVCFQTTLNSMLILVQRQKVVHVVGRWRMFQVRGCQRNVRIRPQDWDPIHTHIHTP